MNKQTFKIILKQHEMKKNISMLSINSLNGLNSSYKLKLGETFEK